MAKPRKFCLEHKTKIAFVTLCSDRMVAELCLQQRVSKGAV